MIRYDTSVFLVFVWRLLNAKHPLDVIVTLRASDRRSQLPHLPHCHQVWAALFVHLSVLTVLSLVGCFRFDWTNRSPIVFDRTSVARVEAVHSGTAHAVFMWWDITMDPAGEVRSSVLLSCPILPYSDLSYPKGHHH